MNWVRRCLALSALLIPFQLSAKQRWELHDVSVLFPLPASTENNLLIRTAELLPKQWTDLFPRLSVRYEPATVMKNLTIVSLRIDAFTHQIKLVWQPVMNDPPQGITTLDTALHSFYQLTPDEFDSFTTALFQYFKQNTQNPYSQKPLNLHPVFAQAEKEKHLLYIQHLMDSFLNSKNLFKVTAMVLRGADDMWAFMGFELKGPTPVPIHIPMTNNSQVQTFVNQAVPFNYFEQFMLSPLTSPTPDPFFESLLGFSIKANRSEQLTEEELQETIHTLRKIENPALVDADSMDCVSCHVAQPIVDYLRLTLKQNFVDDLEAKYANSDFNLNNVHKDINTRRIRGFGYFDNEPAISDRVINDSARNAAEMNSRTRVKKEKEP